MTKKFFHLINILALSLILVSCNANVEKDTIEDTAGTTEDKQVDTQEKEAESDNVSNDKEENSNGQKDKDLEKLIVGYNPGTGNILGFIAMDKGFDKEEGIEIELLSFSNSTDALNALQAKKIDIGVSFGTAAPLTFVSQGADFSIFGGYLSGGMPVFAKQDFEYTGLESFVGKNVGTARMYTPDIVWRAAMMDAGYDLKEDVNIMEFKKPTEVLEAVKSGNVDIAIGTNSTYLQAMQANMKVVAWSNDFWDPVHVCCRPVANTTVINDRKDAFKGFLKSYIRAQQVLREDPEYAVSMNEKYLDLEHETAKTLLLETNQIFETDPKSNGVKHMWNKLIELEYIDPKDINVNDHINIVLYKEALDELVSEYPDNEYFVELQTIYEDYNSEMLKGNQK